MHSAFTHIASIFKPKYIWLLLCFIGIGIQDVSATHLVGGDVTYTYLGNFSGWHRYRITVAVYRDCNIPPSQPSATPFDPEIMLGIYENNNSKSLWQSFTVPLQSDDNVDPFPGGSECPDLPKNICYREGIYRLTVDLPASSNGFHVQYVRCCRNTMVNVPAEEGQTYYAFIPPTNTYTNTSPSFTDKPVPFICVTDTVRILNTATEPDGDSLVFKLALPYAGGDKDDPSPLPTSNFISPIPIRYNAGYSYLKPFGNNGVAEVDPVTGLTKVYATTTGLYAVAIDVHEYRNGVLISTTRRDIQIIVNGCTPNKSPDRTNSGNVGENVTTFYVIAGDKMVIPLKYVDDNKLVLSASGELVDNTITPKGTFTVTEAEANKDLITTFSWQTKCNYARNKPYILNVKVRDNGCPPKTINETYTIFVKRFVGTDKIIGASPACAGAPGERYYTQKVSASSSLVWRTIGGKIISTNDTSALIQWDEKAEGTVKVVEVSANGCPGDTVTKKISVRTKPKAGPIMGTNSPCRNIISSYKVNALPGSTYNWFVTGGTKITSGNDGNLDILWGAEDSGRISLVQQTPEGCFTDTFQFPVDIRGPIIDTIFGSFSVCPNARGVDYWVLPQEGSTYHWKVSGGKQVTGGNTNQIKVDWGDLGGGSVRVVEITKEGCIGDTSRLHVEKDYVLITTPINGDTAVCEFTSSSKYNVLFTNGSIYSWNIFGGTIVQGAGSAEVTVNWDKTGTGFLTVIETAYDSINDKPCTGKPVSLRITINPQPKTKGIFGPAEICEFDSATYLVSGMAGSTFVWTIDNDTLFEGINYNDTFLIAATGANFKKSLVAGNHVIRVQEVSKDSCFGDVLSIPIIIHPKPVTTEISGPLQVCNPNLNNHIYKVQGYDSSTYEWEITGGEIVSGLGTSQITVNWKQAGPGKLNVKEISQFGCIGDVKTLDVKVDSLHLEIERVTTARDNEKVIELYWNVKNSQYLNNSIKVFRMRSGQGRFTLIDSVNLESGKFVDENVATDQYTYSYYLQANNICSEQVKSTVHKTILLKANTINDTTGRIFWTRYQGWPSGTDYHYIYRRLNEDTAIVFHDLAKLDSFLTTYRGLDGYRQCYRVEAVKAQDNELVSWSNSVCFEFEPVLWIPNAFTPGVLDGYNDQFRVILSNYKNFDITIYNRWGERIFTSTDPNNGWDGTFKGVKCPQDVYLYKIAVKGVRTSIYKSGTIHLLR